MSEPKVHVAIMLSPTPDCAEDDVISSVMSNLPEHYISVKIVPASNVQLSPEGDVDSANWTLGDDYKWKYPFEVWGPGTRARRHEALTVPQDPQAFSIVYQRGSEHKVELCTVINARTIDAALSRFRVDHTDARVFSIDSVDLEDKGASPEGYLSDEVLVVGAGAKGNS